MFKRKRETPEKTLINATADTSEDVSGCSIVQKAEQLASQKKAFDELSWGRVQSIAEQLAAAELSADVRDELLDELALIASANGALAKGFETLRAQDLMDEIDRCRTARAYEREKAAQQAAERENTARQEVEREQTEQQQSEQDCNACEHVELGKTESGEQQIKDEQGEDVHSDEDSAFGSQQLVVDTDAVPNESSDHVDDPSAEASEELASSERLVQSSPAHAKETISMREAGPNGLAPTFEASVLPDWARHSGEGEQEALNAFFSTEEEDSKSRSRKVPIVIPRGETGTLPVLGDSSKTALTPSQKTDGRVDGEKTGDGPNLAGFDKLVSSGEHIEQPKDVTEPSTPAKPSEQSGDDKHASTSSNAKGDSGAGKQESWVERRTRKREHKQAAQAARKEKDETEDSTSANGTESSGQGSKEKPKLDFATFRNVYTSRDGGIALYEDADGHITAVNMSRFV